MSETARSGRATRADFMVRSALAIGAAVGAGAAGSWTSRALAKAGDVGVLDFAVRLEHIQTAFYRRAIHVPLVPEVSQLASNIADHEQDHTDGLLSLLTKIGPAPRVPKTKLAVVDQAGYLALAQTLEETTVSVYEGVIPLLTSRDLVAAMASITQVEARHAAAIRRALGHTPAPEPFDKPTSRAAALDAIAALLAP
jgi:rubrerythrin